MRNHPLTLRPVRLDDETFLLEVYASTRLEELAQLPLDENQRETFLKIQFAAQQQDYRRRFPNAEHSVIVLSDRQVGRVYVDRSDKELRILDIALAAEHRNKGTGTRILRGLMDEARVLGKPVRVYVEQFNPALGLFERLGFSRSDDIGTHFLMEWRPGS